MENLRQCKRIFIGLAETLKVSGVLDDYEAMEIEQMKYLERMADGGFEKPMPRLRRLKSSMHSSVIHDDKENSIMPAPKGRPPRKKNRNTKSTINSRPLRTTILTRSSKMSDIASVDTEEEKEPEVKKTRRTRQIKKESVCLEIQSSADTSSVILSATEMSIDSGAKKGRRTTRKRNTETIRASKVTRASFKCKLSGIGGRKSLVGKELKVKKTSVVYESSRLTRSKAVASEDEKLEVMDVNNCTEIISPELKLTPCGQNSVKQRVKEFEGLIDSNKLKEGESIGRPGSPFICSPAPKKAKAIMNSPLVKSEAKKDWMVTCAKDLALVEEEEDPVNRTYQVNKSKDKKKNEKATDEQDMKSFDEVLDADDEWVSDEEEARASSKAFGTPTTTKKTTSQPPLSAKALRSRNVVKVSTDISITSMPKKKILESEYKEAELKKKIEKEEEARKRKEEIMKKRTEAMKKKREEKMAKVKRTREELEKDVKKTKAKKGRPRKAETIEVEEVIKSPLAKLKTPISKPLMAVAVANSTFNVKDQEPADAVSAYNLTPCWQDVPPVQPDNPDDYGVADKSGCSSEEENDPRKKIPTWAKIEANHPNYLSQELLPPEQITSYWNSKPWKPTISQFFGTQVSKRTLKRGLNYRTSSACWNTPPVRK